MEFRQERRIQQSVPAGAATGYVVTRWTRAGLWLASPASSSTGSATASTARSHACATSSAPRYGSFVVGIQQRTAALQAGPPAPVEGRARAGASGAPGRADL